MCGKTRITRKFSSLIAASITNSSGHILLLNYLSAYVCNFSSGSNFHVYNTQNLITIIHKVTVENLNFLKGVRISFSCTSDNSDICISLCNTPDNQRICISLCKTPANPNICISSLCNPPNNPDISISSCKTLNNSIFIAL